MPVNLRPAIAMIELIFALVIMGITLMSAPMLIQQSISSSTTSMQQESIAAAATQINLVTTYPWDESVTGAAFDRTSIAITNAGAAPLRRVPRNNSINNVALTRTYNPDLARIPRATNNIALGQEAGEVDFDDIDDFNGINSNINLYAGEVANFNNDEGDYVDTQVNIVTRVNYGRDTVNNAGNYTGAAMPLRFNNPFQIQAQSTNIKIINVTLTSARNGQNEMTDKQISLSAFACNIGTIPNEDPTQVN